MIAALLAITPIFFSHIAQANVITTFPGSIVPTEAGSIQVDVKLIGYQADTRLRAGIGKPDILSSSSIDDQDFSLAFNANNGSGGGGLSGSRGFGPEAATGWFFEPFTFGSVLGSRVNEWNRYTLVWDQNGLPGIDDGSQRVAVFLNGVLDSGFWTNRSVTDFQPIQGDLNIGVFADDPINDGNGMALDELRIFDGSGNLLLYNRFDKASEALLVSDVGPDGILLNGRFGPGTDGLAVYGPTVVPVPGAFPLLASGVLGIWAIRRSKGRKGQPS